MSWFSRSGGGLPNLGHPDDLVAWRAQRLRAAGFDSRLALDVARDDRFDLHAVLGLIDRGCPAELAVRILAPLE
jgi:hypothetical protein